MATSRRLKAVDTRQSTFLSEAPLAKISAAQGFERALLATEAISPLSLSAWLSDFAPPGLYGRTSLASSRSTKDGHLVPSSGGWQNSGMGSPTAFLTLNTPGWHSDASVCSLSDIVEIGGVPQRYFLSAKACAGILRRAEKRGKLLHPQLRAALQAVADSEPTSTAMED